MKIQLTNISTPTPAVQFSSFFSNQSNFQNACRLSLALLNSQRSRSGWKLHVLITLWKALFM